MRQFQPASNQVEPFSKSEIKTKIDAQDVASKNLYYFYVYSVIHIVIAGLMFSQEAKGIEASVYLTMGLIIILMIYFIQTYMSRIASVVIALFIVDNIFGFLKEFDQMGITFIFVIIFALSAYRLNKATFIYQKIIFESLPKLEKSQN